MKKKEENSNPLTESQLHEVFDSVKALIIMSGDVELAKVIIEEVGQDTLDNLSFDDREHYNAVVKMIYDYEDEVCQDSILIQESAVTE